MEDKEKQLKKLQTLQEEPNLALFDELEDVCDKLDGIQVILRDINIKEVKTYTEELKTLQEEILSLTDSVRSKDTVVNIPLDQLSAQLIKVEQAIKGIGVFKEMKIPEFPIKELEKMIGSLAEKLKQEKLEIPEFDYDRLERKLNEVVRAVKNISVTVSSGGFAERCFDIRYSDKAPAGSYGFTAQKKFGGQDNSGVVVRLSGNLNDCLEIIIQDDLTGLQKLAVTCQGHITQEF